MTPSFELRAATLDDHEAVFSLYENLFRQHVEQIWGWDDAWQAENFAGEWRVARTEVILTGADIVGYLQLKSEPDHCYILSLGIVPDSQGKGIGRRIMSALQQESVQSGLPLKLSVFRTNPRALKFYQSLGFQATEATPEFHRLEWAPG